MSTAKDDISPNPLIAAMAEALAATPRQSPEEAAESRRLAGLRKQYQFLINPNWPDARWDVSGAFIYDRELTSFHDFFLRGHGFKLFSLVHGAPLCLWNSGRVKWQFHRKPHEIERTVLDYARRQIALDATFSNSLLEPKHLDDIRGNLILEMLDQANPTGGNGVIISSELLAEHVRRRHPGLKLVASVVKVTEEDGRGKLDYYRSMAARYDKVMIHPDDNFNLDLLTQLEDKDKYEILVNEPCLRHCQRRKAHYRLLSRFSLNLLDTEVESELTGVMEQNGCSDPVRLLLSQDRRTLTLSTNEIKRLYDIGFRNFKIQGRGLANPTAVILEMVRLMLTHDPDHDHQVARCLAEFMTMLPGKDKGI
jgi:hypothetical protein